MKHSAQQDGFTLIELLVVIVIIGILAGVVAAIINPAEYIAQTRDARRISDLLNVQTSIIGAIANNELQLSDTSTCGDCNSIDSSQTIDGTGWVRFNNVSGNGLINWIQVLPKDPVNEGALMFSYYSDGEAFELNAVLESEKYMDYMLSDGGNDDNVYERGFDLTLN
ncbi:pilin [candidate division WWE3 bacterium]|jgi:prepilin-type N-terminal cleavage/methylation domain-containing protein|nr:pilin [candidate division WWE3 bacterium]MBT7350680.1 pilin [candidate division WWE3 bacterium]